MRIHQIDWADGKRLHGVDVLPAGDFQDRVPEPDRACAVQRFAVHSAQAQKEIDSITMNRWALKPANSILWHDTVLDWLDLWTRRDGKD